MSIMTSLHCSDAVIEAHDPDNCNAIRVRLGRSIQSPCVTLFDLPPAVTDALIAALGQPRGLDGSPREVTPPAAGGAQAQ